MNSSVLIKCNLKCLSLSLYNIFINHYSFTTERVQRTFSGELISLTVSWWLVMCRDGKFYEERGQLGR